MESVPANPNFDVRYVIDPGQGGQPLAVELLTGAAEDDLAPRIAIKGNGDSWVVWWRDGATDEVLYRVRDLQAETWSAEARVSREGENSRQPEITHDGTATWIAYEYDAGLGTGIAVTGIEDDNEPFPLPSTLAITGFSGDVDVLVHSESGHVWVTWVDSDQDVAWSEYDKAGDSWSPVQYETYTSDSVEDARDRIRGAVLGA